MTLYFIGLIIQPCLDDLLKLIYNLYFKWLKKFETKNEILQALTSPYYSFLSIFSCYCRGLLGIAFCKIIMVLDLM